jgi:hypothetical protein
MRWPPARSRVRRRAFVSGSNHRLELTEDDLRQIGTALAHIKVQGERYPAHLAARVER